MSEVHNPERAKVSNGVRRTKPPAASRKAESKPSSWKTPLLVVGAGALGAAAMAAALIVTNQRRSRAYLERREPSFLGALVKVSLLSAARSLTAHLLEKTVLPQLPVFTPVSASTEDSPR